MLQDVFLSGNVVGVQQLVGLVSAGLAQKFLVELFDHGVVVALAQAHALVLVVQGAGAQAADVDVILLAPRRS